MIDVGLLQWYPVAGLHFNIEEPRSPWTNPRECRGELVFRLLLDKYAPHLKPGIDYRPTTDEELHRTAVYRIDIETWSGKQKEVAEDFPGAFSLEVPPVPFPKRAAGSY